jgi:hypothetical protein
LWKKVPQSQERARVAQDLYAVLRGDVPAPGAVARVRDKMAWVACVTYG